MGWLRLRRLRLARRGLRGRGQTGRRRGRTRGRLSAAPHGAVSRELLLDVLLEFRRNGGRSAALARATARADRKNIDRTPHTFAAMLIGICALIGMFALSIFRSSARLLSTFDRFTFTSEGTLETPLATALPALFTPSRRTRPSCNRRRQAE